MSELKVRIGSYAFSGFVLGNIAWFLLPESFQYGQHQTWGEFILHVGWLTGLTCAAVTVGEYLYVQSKDSDEGSNDS